MLAWNFDYQFEILIAKSNFECQYENLDACQNFAKFHESSQTQWKTLSLSTGKQDFWRNDSKARYADFPELTRILI